MNRHSVSDQKIKQQIYKICFEDLTLRNKLFNKRTRRFELVFVISCSLLMMQLLLFIVLFLVSGYTPGYIYGIFLVCLGTITLLSHLATIQSSREYIRSEYKELSYLIGKSKFTYDREILFALRCDEIYYFLRNNRFNHNNFDNLIQYYSHKGESIRKQRWLPIAILATFILPFWNASVSKNLVWTEIDKVVPLALFAIFLPTAVWVWRKNIEMFFLSKSNNYNELTIILRTVKSFPKFRD